MLGRTTRSVQFLALATVVAVGCGDSLGPLSSESQPEPNFSAAATQTPFSAIWVNPGGTAVPRFTGQAIHWRDDVLTGPISGDLVGTATFMGDTDANFANLKASIRGTMTIDLTGGTFEGRSQAVIDFSIGLSEGHFQGKGTGAYAGQKIYGTFSNAPGFTPVFAFEGYIVNPRP